jgi:hypothetical protein
VGVGVGGVSRLARRSHTNRPPAPLPRAKRGTRTRAQDVRTSRALRALRRRAKSITVNFARHTAQKISLVCCARPHTCARTLRTLAAWRWPLSASSAPSVACPARPPPSWPVPPTSVFPTVPRNESWFSVVAHDERTGMWRREARGPAGGFAHAKSRRGGAVARVGAAADKREQNRFFWHCQNTTFFQIPSRPPPPPSAYAPPVIIVVGAPLLPCRRGCRRTRCSGVAA